MRSISQRIIVVWALACLATPAGAQQMPPERPERPYRGLFGGGVGETEQSLTANASIGGGVDGNVLAETSANDTNQGVSGGFGSASAGLSYSLNRARFNMNASGSAGGRYVAPLRPPVVATHTANVFASVAASRRIRVSGGHSISRQPYLTLAFAPPLFALADGEVVVPDPSLGIRRDEYLVQSSTADVAYSVGRRSSFGASIGLNSNGTRSDRAALATRTAGARFRFGITDGLGIRLGSSYSENEIDDAGTRRLFVTRGIDAGLDFNRALSLTRRTTVSFASGSSSVIDDQRTHYVLTGSARLNREIGRSWNASVAYSRDVNFVQRFRDPFLAHSLTGGFAGQISRRTRLTTGATGSIGELGLGGDATDYQSVTATAALSIAATRYVAVALTYNYFMYEFAAASALPTGVLPNVDRQNVTVAVNLWAPLLHRTRRADAAR